MLDVVPLPMPTHLQCSLLLLLLFPIAQFSISTSAPLAHPPAVFIIDDGQGGQWYGFPEHGPQPGFKIGRYNHLRQVVHPDSVSR
jgi:hypothetical protein